MRHPYRARTMRFMLPPLRLIRALLRMDVLREIDVVDSVADLSCLGLAIDDASQRRELDAQPLVIMEAADLRRRLARRRLAGDDVLQLRHLGEIDHTHVRPAVVAVLELR